MTHETLNNGTQVLFRFPNDYGASVVQHDNSYGQELSVIHYPFRSSKEFDLIYDTPITVSASNSAGRPETLGYLSDINLLTALSAIAALPERVA